MRVALDAFLKQTAAIDRTVDLRDDLVAFGQARSDRQDPAGAALRRAVRRGGLSGLQPTLDASVLLIAAAFEQFVTDVIVAFAADLPNKVPSYSRLPPAITSANERMTGEALNEMRSRFEASDLRRFVDNLRNCQAGVVPYVLNGEAMALNNRNLTPNTLRELVARLGLNDVWTAVASTNALKNWSGPGGKKVARSRAMNELTQIIRQRNQIAHRVGTTTPGPAVIRSYIRFERALARGLVKSLEDYGSSL